MFIVGIQETTNMAINKKIERAYIVKDINFDDLGCAMVTLIDENYMKEFIKLPAGAKHSQTWAKGVELEKAYLKNSSKLCSDFETGPRVLARWSLERVLKLRNSILVKTPPPPKNRNE